MQSYRAARHSTVPYGAIALVPSKEGRVLPHPRTLTLLLIAGVLGPSVLFGCSKGPVKPSKFEAISGEQASKGGKTAGTPRGEYMQNKKAGMQQKGQ